MEGFTFKSFELHRKTQVGSRIDSFNSTHFHLAHPIRGNRLFYGRRVEFLVESLTPLNPKL